MCTKNDECLTARAYILAVLFFFRNKNGFGAKVLNQRYIQTSPAPALEVVNMADDTKGLFLNPNDFPGYQEMIVKNM